MKKARLFTLLTMIIMLTLLVFVGCQKEEKVTSVSFKDHDPSIAHEMTVGNFAFDTYTVVVVYESGRTEELPLTPEMLEQTDLLKLYQVGEHDITVNYGACKYTFKVSVKRSTFGNLAFPENNVFTYDGKTHTVEVDGNIPANAVVTYPGGNSFVNAGIYDVVAIVSCDGYVTEKLTTTVKIERAKYDMSGVKFDGKEVVYDGSSHSLKISGTLPEGVASPTYTINGKTTSSATDVGEYTVKATFDVTNPNYEAIPEMSATLKIIPAEYTVNGVDIVFKDKDGNILKDASKIYDAKSVTFDLNDYNRLPKRVTAHFSVFDKDGTVISTSNKDTGILNAGVYTVRVEFTLADSKNYKPIEPIVRTFEIFKTEYPPIENVNFGSDQITYDGKEHSIAIEGRLPNGVTVSYEYYKGGARVDGADGKPVQAVVDAGRYTVKAVFTHTDANCGEIEPISATLFIEQATIDTSLLKYDYNPSWVYDGTAKSVVTSQKPEYIEISYEYYLNGELVTNDDGTPASAVTEVGEYTVKVIINVTNGNYAPMEPLSVTFAIVAQND